MHYRVKYLNGHGQLGQVMVLANSEEEARATFMSCASILKARTILVIEEVYE